MDVVLTVKDEEMKAYFNMVDNFIVAKVFEEQTTVFGPKSTLPLETIKIMYQPVLKASEKYDPTIRVKVMLTGPEFVLTKIIVAKSDPAGGPKLIKAVDKGWEFLKEQLGDDKLHKYKAAVKLAFRSIKVWNQNQKFSLAVEAEEILFFPSEENKAGTTTFGLSTLLSEVMGQQDSEASEVSA